MRLRQEHFFKEDHMGMTKAAVGSEFSFNMLGDFVWASRQKFDGHLLSGLPASVEALSGNIALSQRQTGQHVRPGDLHTQRHSAAMRTMQREADALLDKVLNR